MGKKTGRIDFNGQKCIYQLCQFHIRTFLPSERLYILCLKAVPKERNLE